MKILVVKPSSLGDIIHTFPAVDLIRQEYPEASISWLVNDSLAGIIDLFPGVDEAIYFRRRRLGKIGHWHEFIPFITQLRQSKFDVVLDFQGLFRSGVISFLSGSPRRVGFRDAREGAHRFYNEQVRLPANLEHAVDKNIFLVRTALNISSPARVPPLASHHDFSKCAARLFQENKIDVEAGPVLAVAPGARWESKRWPPEFFAKVLDLVAEQIPGLQCWVLGSADERKVAGEVISHCRKAAPVNLAGTTNLGTLAELLRSSDALLSNDSGPMHLAAALETPTAALFGPTSPEKTGPYGDGHGVFVGTCEQRPCFRRECPADRMECRLSIAPASVARYLVERLPVTNVTEPLIT